MKIKITFPNNISRHFDTIVEVLMSRWIDWEIRESVKTATNLFESSALIPCDIHCKDGTIISFLDDITQEEHDSMDDIADGQEIYRNMQKEVYSP